MRWLLALSVTSVAAMVFPGPAPTVYREDLWDIRGTTPRPTPAAKVFKDENEFRMWDLVRRQYSSPGMLGPAVATSAYTTVGLNTCGYINGNFDWPITCGPEYVCVVDASTSLGGFGCATASVENGVTVYPYVQEPAATCFDYGYVYTYSTGSSYDRTIYCPQTEPSCIAYYLYDSTAILSELGCSTARMGFSAMVTPTYTAAISTIPFSVIYTSWPDLPYVIDPVATTSISSSQIPTSSLATSSLPTSTPAPTSILSSQITAPSFVTSTTPATTSPLFSTSTTQPAPLTSTSSASPPYYSPPPSHHTAAIAGGAAGGAVVLIALFGGLIWYCVKQNRKRQQEDAQKNQAAELEQDYSNLPASFRETQTPKAG